MELDLMKSKLYCKILAIGIICLFVGVGIHPAFAVDTRQSIVNKASVEDCGCNEVSDADLILVERLLDRVEFYSKLLLVLSRYNPEVLEDYEELTDMITTLKTLDLKDIICNWLTNMSYTFYVNFLQYLEKAETLQDENRLIAGLIAEYTAYICFGIFAVLAELYYVLGC